MIRKIFLLLLLIFGAISLKAQTSIESPAEFLGYGLGTHFTPDYKVVEYFNYLAQHIPNMEVQQYGTTNEGKPLIMAIITSPENFAQLEDIRTNNLRLAGELPGQGNENMPPIIWMSYNVHGNEAAPSEAAMETIYNLVNGNDPQVSEWLQKVVVIIDPCLNPDGHDRYVDFYNKVAEKYPDLASYAREHHEPWPGGRFNHYYFDLNRDWAWETQKETIARLAVFHQWLPEVHVDFHEMGVNDPYYFPPGAHPMNDIITPWEKQVQDTFGRNNAKYFNEFGWLYFTKEEYDLFYPGYGDTYPLYNGSIGMTYEQGGGAEAGLAIQNEEGDTITLAKRIAHHYITSMATIEAAADHASELVQHFRQYYENAIQHPEGEYKTYVVKDQNRDRLQDFATLLTRNHIQFGFGVKGSITGFDYFTGKEETTNIAPQDMVINAYQPASHLLKVLMEPQAHLEDSLTYDITAWSLPYAYGLPTFASKQSIKPVSDTMPVNPDTAITADDSMPYAYLCQWQSMEDARFLAALLQQGIKVRYAEDSFRINNKDYVPGTLIITRTSNEMVGDKLREIIHQTADHYHRIIDEVSSGYAQSGIDLGSYHINYLAKPHVVVLAGSGVDPSAMGEVWQFFEQQLNYPVTVADVKDIDQVDWHDVDVLVLADGRYSFLTDSSQLAQLKSWVQNGGRIIAMGNAVEQLSATDWGLKAKKDTTHHEFSFNNSLEKYANRERDDVADNVSGSIFKVQLDNTHPLAYGYPDYYYTLKMDDNIYEPLGDGGWNVGVIKKDALVSGYVGTAAKQKLQDGLIFGVQDIGKGHVIYLADDVLFRGFWQNGKLMFCNALFMAQ